MSFTSISSVFASASRFLPQSVCAPSGSRSASSYVHLGDLQPSRGSTKTHIRLGRGQGSTKGGTAGRGHKGQRARSGNGKPSAGFEGGQTPITRLFPKRGFINFTSRTYAPLQISKLQSFLSLSRLSPDLPIDIGTVVRSNLVHGISGYDGIKLVGDVDPSLPLPPLSLRLSRYSRSAAKAITQAGGELTAVYHNALSLRQEVWPEKFVGREVKEAKPIRKNEILYYSDAKKYGYLAQKEGAVVETES
ncbi:large subunit ribosomal protein L15, partial [Tremellales sp. Uapishka_1]